MTYYQMVPFTESGAYWQLDIPTNSRGKPVDVWAFSRGSTYRASLPLSVRVSAPGDPADITVSAFGFPVVSKRCARVIADVCSSACELIPVTVEGHDTYFIVNTLVIADCLDATCVSSYFPDDHWDKPKAGKPRMIIDLALRAERLPNAHWFRIQDWPIPVIVSDKLATRLREAAITGFATRAVEVR